MRKPKPSYGPGFHRMKTRLGPERMEEIRQLVLKEQLEARKKWAPPAVQRDRTSYKDYPAVYTATGRIRPKTGGYVTTIPKKSKPRHK